MSKDYADIEDGYVWLVYSTLKGAPFLLSVHTHRVKAYEARRAYIADAEFGAEMDNYWISSMRMNWTGVEKK